MARTKQTVRKSTSDKAPRRPAMNTAQSGQVKRKGAVAAGEDKSGGEPCSKMRKVLADAPPLESAAVTVLLGRLAEPFSVVLGDVAKHSKFFHDFTSAVVGVRSKAIDLKDFTAAAFTLFLHFIRDGKVYSVERSAAKLPKPKSTTAAVQLHGEWARLSDAWFLGNRLQSITFKDAVVDAMLEKLKLDQKQLLALANAVFGASQDASGLRQLLVDTAQTLWTAEQIRDPDPKTTSSSFLIALATALKTATHREDQAPGATDDTGCKYHEHDAESCYKTMFVT